MSTGKELLYWDSCAFLAFLKGETYHGPGELEALQRQAFDFDRGIINLASSTISALEVLSCEITPEQRHKFDLMTDRSNFIPVEATMRIMRFAAEIRRYYYGRFPHNGMELRVGSPDAIHVASSIEISAPALITLDRKDKPSRSEVGLIRLMEHGQILGRHTLDIRQPATGTGEDMFNTGGAAKPS